MAYEQVNVVVEEAGKVGVPVPGVLVRAYSAEGDALFGEGTTDAEGRAGFLLSDQEYSFRFYKYQVGFTQPQRFTVESDPSTPGVTPNDFVAYAALLEKPLAVDARLCRCSGYFRDVTGAPRVNLGVQFIGDFRPLLLDGALVMDERRTMRTNEDGWGCIDLIRGACYSVTLDAWEGEQRLVRVPDAPCANLPDVLFPVVGTVVQAPIAVPVGESLDVFPVVLDSAGIPIEGTAHGDVQWSTEDPTVATVQAQRDKLVIQGVTAGATTLVAVRRDNSIVRVPNGGIDGIPAAITVG